jgi:DNA-directed RNA polymerase specialized sigma24 family protein
MIFVDSHGAQTSTSVEDTVKIFATKHTRPQTLYATAADFCRIFEDNMDRLYLLSLLLTADYDLAEKCFVAGLETSKASNPVFKDWAQSWARRTIITNAIRIIGPRPENALNHNPENVPGLPTELAAVISLNTFDRFVFVMSVLEGYAERDCRVLLHCSASDIAQARTRALQQLGALVQKYGKTENTIQLQSKADDRELTLAPGLVPRLAASA